MEFNYDIVVVGAGHAGNEAACAAANLGSKTVLITMDMKFQTIGSVGHNVLPYEHSVQSCQKSCPWKGQDPVTMAAGRHGGSTHVRRWAHAAPPRGELRGM